MTDVEGLLRETLNDPRRRLEPAPGMFETVRERARQRRQRVVRLASALTAIAVVAGVATAIGITTQRHGQVTIQQITPAPSGLATPINLGVGTTSAFALAPSGIFVARTQPNQLVEVSTADQSVVKRIATPDAVDGVAVDAPAGLVWTWSSIPATAYGSVASGDSVESQTIFHGYTTSTLKLEALAAIPADVFSVAVLLNGDLLIATSDGVYEVSPPNAVTKRLSGSVFSVAADDAHNRVLFGMQVTGSAAGNDSLGSVVVHAFDTQALGFTTLGLPVPAGEESIGSPLPVGKESIAVVDGQVWVGGYGSGLTARLFHLDASSLRPLKSAVPNAGDELQLGPGAIVWPGASVLWVRSGGSERLSCVDPKTGAVLEQWDAVQGPVTSVRGHAYAVSDGSLEQLSLAGGCTG